MAFSKRCLLFFCFAAALFQASIAKVYHVGFIDGWSIKGAKAYRHWAANRTLEVGDSFVFIYKPYFHNVVQVRSHDAYKQCNLDEPLLVTDSTGYDIVTITKAGRYFFVDGIAEYCQDGQKVAIRVGPPNNSAAPAPVSFTGHSPSHSRPNNSHSPSHRRPNKSAAPAPVSVTSPSPSHSLPNNSHSPSHRRPNNSAVSSTTSVVGATILALLLGFVMFLGFSF